MRTQVLFLVAVLTVARGAAGEPVSHWRAENNALDSVGPNHGTVNGELNYTDGVVGRAFLFPDDGYIRIPNPAAGGLVSAGGFSVAMWVRLDGADPPPEGGPGALVHYGTGPNIGGFVISQSGSTGSASPLAFRVGTNDGVANVFTFVESPFPDFFTFGQFHHLAVTFNAATHSMALYRDGVLQNQRFDVPGTHMVTDPAAVFDFGRFAVNGATLHGALDEIRFFDHALSPAEVIGLIPEPACTPMVAIGIVARWRRR